MNDMFDYYTDAPVKSAIQFNDDKDYHAKFRLEEFGENVYYASGDGEIDNNLNISMALDHNVKDYNHMLENEVRVAFDKYDADGSGTIDKEELGELSKELGHELT